LDSVHADVSVGEMKQEYRRMTAARCNIVFTIIVQFITTLV
jgi:hypothetical protein